MVLPVASGMWVRRRRDGVGHDATYHVCKEGVVSLDYSRRRFRTIEVLSSILPSFLGTDTRGVLPTSVLGPSTWRSDGLFSSFFFFFTCL
mmetsp:Transcript_23498/g.93150  ORF Transcript_23498/g.93150 Transcript_23498/m.93150 type:complete len:90 (-) Transcript_23498:35-304(-)